MRHYDTCIITAANGHQAEGYRDQLQWRRNRQMLPAETEFLVYADPAGKRIGSGGSTVYVLHRLLQRANGDFERAFRSKRILILHSGGDSRRLPAYSATGKAFTPLPTEKFFALFDALFDQLAKLPTLDDGQVVVASGDVLLTFEPEHVDFSHTGVTGVAYPDLPSVASGHGVYVSSVGAAESNPRRVVDFLQKPNLAELQGAKALDMANRAFVDTGIMNFAVDVVKRFIGLSDLNEKISRGGICLDLYREIAFAMAGKEQIHEAEALFGVPFFVSQLPYCGFFHIGKSGQFLRSLYTLTHAGVLYDFRNFTRSDVRPSAALSNAFVYNALIDTDDVEIGEPVLIEGCELDGALRLESENILTGVPRGVGNIALKRGVCLSIVPVKDGGWASILYGIHDDFKYSHGDEQCTWLNPAFRGTFAEWLGKGKTTPTEIWQEGDPRELWNARIFPVSPDPEEAVQISLGLQDGGPDNEAWRASRRMSLNEVLRSADHKRLLEAYSSRGKRAKVVAVAARLTPENDLSSSEAASWCQSQDDCNRLAKNVLTMIKRSDDLLFQARLYKLLSNLARKTEGRQLEVDSPGLELGAEALENKAFALIREAIGKGLPRDESGSPKKIRIRSDEVVWICVPARLDFAGGWLDTPPQCLERGGSVLNAAVTLNGQYPIQVIGKVCAEPVIRINSIDLGDRAVVADRKELLSYSDPSDWLALPKSAFVAAGLISPETDHDLGGILKEFGGGIDLTLFSAVPSGSGLGTSSILGAGIIACLSRMFGIDLTQNDLFNRTLYMEQLMTTGGGWQDQIGGVVGGIKLIRTEPGLFQAPSISWTGLIQPGTALSDRFLLYYTGHRRMAKNILRHIVGRYLERDSRTLDAMRGLHHISIQMKETLDRRDVDAFGAQVAEVWKLNKQLDPGSSNDDIEAILARISKYILGAKLLGAGGGGFLFIVTKGMAESLKVREILTKQPPNALARFFDFNVDETGLQASVL